MFIQIVEYLNTSKANILVPVHFRQHILFKSRDFPIEDSDSAILLIDSIMHKFNSVSLSYFAIFFFSSSR